MKTYFYLFLCIILICMCGCGEGSQKETLPTSTSNLTSAPEPIPVPQVPGNDLTEYDPEREIYLYCCENIEQTIYFGSTCNSSVSFYILSKKRLKEDTVQVSVACQNSYKVRVKEIDVESYKHTEYSVLEPGQNIGEKQSVYYFPYYLYQCYTGVDFEQLQQMYLSYYEAAMGAGAFSEDALQTLKEYQKLRDAAMDDFKKITSDDIREFYVYNVRITFDGKGPDEYITAIDLSINGEIYHQDKVKIHLVPDRFPTKYTRKNLPKCSSGGLMAPEAPYGQGINDFSLSFTAEEDLTLLEFSIHEDSFQILDILLSVSSAGGESINFYWDGNSPIDVRKGDKVDLYLYFKHPLMNKFSFGVRMHTDLAYETSEGFFSNRCECIYWPAMFYNLHEIYAVTFDGLNIADYYKNYYYPVVRPDIAEYFE